MPKHEGAKIMSMLRTLLAAALLLAPAALLAEEPSGKPAASEAELQVLVDAIRANRKALVAVNLALSDQEAAKFWPIYDRYEKEIHAIGDRNAAVIQEYIANFRTLSDETAMKLMNDYLAVEADRLKVRQAYLGEFAKVVSGRTVARLYQIENKFDAVVRYDLAAVIPVVDQKAEAPAK